MRIGGEAPRRRAHSSLNRGAKAIVQHRVAAASVRHLQPSVSATLGCSNSMALTAPGEAYQFDWSHEIVVMDGVTTTVKVAHVRLCHSRMMLARAYPRETQEMVFDAHERAFAFFRGACLRGIPDYVASHIIGILWPPPLCGAPRAAR